MRGCANGRDHCSAFLKAGRNFISTEIISLSSRPSRTAAIVSRTFLLLRGTSTCQNRRTDQPFLFIVSSRKLSRFCSACWLPSTSTTRLASRQAKSAKYGPMGNCRTNLCPFKRRPRNSCHNASSASFSTRRSSLALVVLPRMALSLIRPFGPPSSRERGKEAVRRSSAPSPSAPRSRLWRARAGARRGRSCRPPRRPTCRNSGTRNRRSG